MSLAALSPHPPPARVATTSFRDLPLLAQASLLALGGSVVALSARLWPEWRSNPDLSHGLLMPVIFLFLVHEARTRGRPRFLPRRAGVRLALLALLTAGVATLASAGLFAAAVDWSHALVQFTLALALVFFLAGAVIAGASDDTRLIGFNWPILVAIGLWLLSAPLPPGTYSRLTLNLQLWVSEGVLRSLHVLGIAAERYGNVIEMANAKVGVEEACSGIRSLLSCVFAGFFLSATLVRRPLHRAIIIVLSVPLALGMNFFRSLGLTLLANNGVDIGGAWHDVTGFAVLGATAALLAGLALLFERHQKQKAERAPAPAPAAAAPPPPVAPPARSLVNHAALAAALGVAFTLIAIFVLNTRPAAHHDAPTPDLLAVLPASPDGWRVTTRDLYEFRGTLQTDYLVQRRYEKTDARGSFDVTLYLAYWRPGQVPVSQVAVHTPDACAPGGGWVPQRTASARVNLTSGERPLAAAEYRLFTTGDYPQHVWFWHLYAGRPIDYRDPYSPRALLQIAWRYGFRHDGDQLFVRVSSNRPWSELAREPLLAEFFARTRPLGL